MEVNNPGQTVLRQISMETSRKRVRRTDYSNEYVHSFMDTEFVLTQTRKAPARTSLIAICGVALCSCCIAVCFHATAWKHVFAKRRFSKRHEILDRIERSGALRKCGHKLEFGTENHEAFRHSVISLRTSTRRVQVIVRVVGRG